MSARFPCIACKKTVRSNQHAFQCDRCQEWQHVGCNSGFTHRDYLQILDDPSRLEVWICAPCTNQNQQHEEQPMDIEVEDDGVADDGDVQSFNIDTDFVVPRETAENAIPDAAIPDVIPGQGEEVIKTYKIVEAGTKCGHDILVDSHGYSYTKKWKKAGSSSSKVTWLCSVRGKLHRCAVSVHQDGDVFAEGLHALHTHPAHPGADLAVEVKADVKSRAKTEVFKSAGAIVEEVISTKAPPEAPAASCPSLSNLSRAANRHRQSQRPPEPRDLDFILHCTSRFHSR